MFRKQNNENPQPDKQQNRIDELANRLQREGKINQLEHELMKFSPATLSGVERESWFHLYGIMPFQQGNRSLAFDRFREGLTQCPNSAFLSFSLGQEYEFKADITNMFECFDKAKFPEVSAQYALAEARYAYLWNHYDKALSYIEPLIPIYFALKNLDSTFLHIRGIPPFSQIWAYLAAFHQLSGSLQELKAITARAEAECSDFDFGYLNAEFKRVEIGDISNVKERLKSSIAESKKNNWPTGYQSMQYQILISQLEDDPVEAERMLDSVSLGQNDFPWLDDMRLLAKCELSHRIENTGREKDLQAQFLRRQPLLFEPDNAINFNLLKYQENLKRIYHETRTKPS